VIVAEPGNPAPLHVEFIDKNGGGPGGAATKAAPEEELGGWEKRRCRHYVAERSAEPARIN